MKKWDPEKLERLKWRLECMEHHLRAHQPVGRQLWHEIRILEARFVKYWEALRSSEIGSGRFASPDEADDEEVDEKVTRLPSQSQNQRGSHQPAKDTKTDDARPQPTVPPHALPQCIGPDRNNNNNNSTPSASSEADEVPRLPPQPQDILAWEQICRERLARRFQFSTFSMKPLYYGWEIGVSQGVYQWQEHVKTDPHWKQTGTQPTLRRPHTGAPYRGAQGADKMRAGAHVSPSHRAGASA